MEQPNPGTVLYDTRPCSRYSTVPTVDPGEILYQHILYRSILFSEAHLLISLKPVPNPDHWPVHNICGSSRSRDRRSRTRERDRKRSRSRGDSRKRSRSRSRGDSRRRSRSYSRRSRSRYLNNFRTSLILVIKYKTQGFPSFGLGHACASPPGFWNGVDWRALVEDYPPRLVKLIKLFFFCFFGKKNSFKFQIFWRKKIIFLELQKKFRF